MEASTYLRTLLCCLLLSSPCASQTKQDARQLLSDMLVNCTSGVRPNEDQSQPTVINLTISLFVLVDTDEQSGLFSVSSQIGLTWIDPHFQWNQASYGGLTSLLMDLSAVWAPTLVIYTPVEPVATYGRGKEKVRYTNDGVASVLLSDLIQVHCQYNTLNYPFDVQTCYIKVFATDYNNTEVQLFPTSDKVDLSAFTENDKWIISEANNFIYKYQHQTAVTVEVVIHRRWQFFLLTNVVPIFFILFLNAMVFVLPQESGERVGYAITCLLSLAVFLTIITNELPAASSNMSRISIYITIMLGLSTIICFLTIITLKVYTYDGLKPVPPWLQRLTLMIHFRQVHGRCCYRRNKISVKSTPNEGLVVVTSDQTELKPSLHFDKSVSNVQWKDVGLGLDRCFFVGSILLSTLISIYFFVLISSN